MIVICSSCTSNGNEANAWKFTPWDRSTPASLVIPSICLKRENAATGASSELSKMAVACGRAGSIGDLGEVRSWRGGVACGVEFVALVNVGRS